MAILTGTAGNDTLTGANLDDQLNGLAGADKMSGGKGNDLYYVDNTKDVVTEKAREGSDYVHASVNYALGANVENLILGDGDLNGSGNALDNVLLGTSGSNKLAGGAGDDFLDAGDGSDTLEGGTGDDYLDGDAGNDLMKGGAGDDIYIVEQNGDVAVEAAGNGNDTIGTSFDFDLATDSTNIENLTLRGLADLIGKGNGVANILTGNGGKNLLDGAAGNDVIVGAGGDDTLQGGLGNDQLFGGDDDDQLSGGDGDDYLEGGFGTNTLTGGKGNDVYDIANAVAANTIVELADEGIDTVTSNKTTDLNAAGFKNIENLILGGDTIITGWGNAWDNIITGNGASNELYGDTGNDTLSGGNGDDSLNGGIGNDAMIGGRGDDSYLVTVTGDKVTEKAGEGYDTVRTYLTTYVLGDNIETLQFTAPVAAVGTGNALANNIHGAIGNDVLDGKSGDDYLYGNGGDDTLIGGVGNDLMLGGIGNDAMTGGKGNDIYYVDSKHDAVTELAGQGTDLIYSDISLDLAGKAVSNVENLALQGSGDLTGYGNALANAITGNSGQNYILGLAGNDRLDGGLGNDALDGGHGDDVVEGGAGNDGLFGAYGQDTLSGGEGDDKLSGEDGNDVLDGGSGVNLLWGGAGNDVYVVSSMTNTIEEMAGAGIDEIRSEIAWSLAGFENVENLTLTSGGTTGIGNALGNVIKASDAGNALDGGAGNDILLGGKGQDFLVGELGDDRMSGGQGDDIYYVDSARDIVIEGVKQGHDVVYTTLGYKLGANLEELGITSAADVNGTGNALDNVLAGNVGRNRLDGLAGNDFLLGAGGADTLLGGAGNDTLEGGEGADEMKGGAGNDTYFVESIGDKVIEVAGQGIDLVHAALDFDLETHGANIENLSAANANGVALFGNKLNNVIYGHIGADLLSGRQGHDLLEGANGKDTLLGGDGDDRLFGGDSDDELDGGAGNDRLQGDLGTNKLTGGAGNDIYVLSGGTDTIIELKDEGIDEVLTQSDYTLSGYLENLTLTGTLNVDGTGNEAANLITGNYGDNELAGLAGNDTLSAGNGNDRLDGGTGKDVMRGGQGADYYYVDDARDQVIEAANEGYDVVVTTLSHYTLGANVEVADFDLIATDAVGKGNALHNYIYGNTGNDTLSGLAGNDNLFGGSGNDTLTGGAGDDGLTGGQGNDMMIGGAGNDGYAVDAVGDVVQETANGGIDTVYAYFDYTLGAHVEHAVAAGTGLTITGNDLNNMMQGYDGGFDRLDGGKGADRLFGYGGTDELNGGDGNDVIEGGLGADTMNGGAGNDVFGYTLGDTGGLSGLGGDDTITGFEVGKDKIDILDLIDDFDVGSDPFGAGYLKLSIDNGNTLLQFDTDGGGDSFVTLATVQGVTNLTLSDLIYQQETST
jgi:Ca2+-binding RTX toxin-like protein